MRLDDRQCLQQGSRRGQACDLSILMSKLSFHSGEPDECDESGKETETGEHAGDELYGVDLPVAEELSGIDLAIEAARWDRYGR